jgi:MFS family permease
VADLSPKERLARNMALFQGFHHLGMSFGPSLGGFLGEQMGYRFLFFSYAGLMALGMLLIPWTLRVIPKFHQLMSDTRAPGGAEDRQQKGWADWKTMSCLLSSRAFILIAALEFIIFFARNGAQFTIVPLLGTHNLDLKVGQIGLTLTLVALSQLSILYLAGWLSDRFGVTKVLIPGILVASGSYFFFAVSRDYISFLSAGVILGIGTGLGMHLPPVYAAQTRGDVGYGLVVGTLRFFGDVGLTIGPIILGLISDVADYRQALMINASLMFGGIILFALLAPKPSMVSPKHSTP